MSRYQYLTLLPEAFVASELPPWEFGVYCTKTSEKRTRGEAIYIEVDPKLKSEFFPQIKDRIPQSAHSRRFVYIAIYRALEHIPVRALRNLYIAADNGEVLEIAQKAYMAREKSLHYYQEILPVASRLASTLDPIEFCHYVTDPKRPIHFPRLAFVELQLQDLASDPLNAKAENLPYPNLPYLRKSLINLKEDKELKIKTVLRCMHCSILYRTIRNGFFVGDQKELCFYPFPEVETLETQHYAWWRRAQNLNIGQVDIG